MTENYNRYEYVLSKIKESCDIHTSLGLAMAGKLLNEVPVSFSKNIVKQKVFVIKMPYVMKQKDMSVKEHSDMISAAALVIVPYFKELNEKFNITITALDTAIDEIDNTYKFMVDYVLERKQ